MARSVSAVAPVLRHRPAGPPRPTRPGQSAGTATTAARAAPAALAAFATSAAALRPGASLSGQAASRRPRSGVQSALPTACAPPGHVTGTKSGKMPTAASAAFSPSTTSTGAAGRAASRSSP